MKYEIKVMIETDGKGMMKTVGMDPGKHIWSDGTLLCALTFLSNKIAERVIKEEKKRR